MCSTAKYRVTVECTYVAQYEVLVEEASVTAARERAKRAVQSEEFDWSLYQGPQTRIIECEQEVRDARAHH